MYAAAKLLQSCPTLCDPTDGSPLDSSVQIQRHYYYLISAYKTYIKFTLFNTWLRMFSIYF